MFDLASYLETAATVQAKYNDDTEYVIKCENCDRDKQDHEWRLWVNVEKRKGICYKCRMRLPDDVAIVQYVEGCEFRQALEIVRDGESPMDRFREIITKLYGIERQVEKDESVPDLQLPSGFIPAWSSRRRPEYFKERGLSSRDCRNFLLGWCETGFFGNRLIVPVFNDGRLVSFVARWMGGVPPNGKKVIYPKGSKTSKVLYNLETARKHKTVVVTEGVFDAIKVGMKGVALFGKTASVQQKKLLIGVGSKRRLVIMLDRDAERDAYDLAVELADVCDDVRVAFLPPGKDDPGECTRLELKNAVKQAKIIDQSRLFFQKIFAVA